MEKIKILFADDHTLFRDGLRNLLTSISDFEIIGEATSGEEAITLANSLQPDIVLMDIKMPNMNGIEATKEILAKNSHIGIIMFTMFEDDNSVFAAMRAGAKGYLLKGASQEETLRAIRAIASGEAIFSPSIAARLIHYFNYISKSQGNIAFPELTSRERQILNLIVQGTKNEGIAERLGLSSKTVRNHVSNIYNKLQVADRFEAIKRAKEGGME